MKLKVNLIILNIQNFILILEQQTEEKLSNAEFLNWNYRGWL